MGLISLSILVYINSYNLVDVLDRRNFGGNYVDYNIEGVMYDPTTKYEGLITTISSQLGVDTIIYHLELRYFVSGPSPPMKIHNDTGVQVYLDQKRCNSDFFSKYSLCVIYVDKAMKSIEYQINVQTTRKHILGSNTLCLANMDPILEGYIEESEGTEIISNPQHYLVAEDQVYINKQTISEVMKRYAFLREFCFIAKRSSPTCYYLKCATENCSWDRIQSKRQSTSGVLGAMLVEKYVDLKTVYTPTNIQADMLRIHGISLTYMQAWRALDASIRGWEYCRPIVVVDGTHLKSTYEGTMLIASTLDPGGTVYTITATRLVRASTIHLHTITDGAKRFTVCLNTRMCSCGRFQHDEIPCSHALAAIRHRNKHRDDYCSAYYSNKNYQDTYAIPIEPLSCESTWGVPSHVLEEVVLPPITRKQPGRPPKNDRKKGFTEGEGKNRKLCDIMNSFGLRVVTYPEILIKNEPIG
ncbi:hypothetical protein KY284_013239 [Solanum tuberosum]|nr:hypothetical protein KY284_013239 [Solanum tuberosum]